MEVSQGILMKRVKINHPDAKEIFIDAIHDNQVIAYPTDTIYGLGTSINNDEGIKKLTKRVWSYFKCFEGLHSFTAKKSIDGLRN